MSRRLALLVALATTLSFATEGRGRAAETAHERMEKAWRTLLAPHLKD